MLDLKHLAGQWADPDRAEDLHRWLQAQLEEITIEQPDLLGDDERVLQVIAGKLYRVDLAWFNDEFQRLIKETIRHAQEQEAAEGEPYWLPFSPEQALADVANWERNQAARQADVFRRVLEG